VTDAVELNGTGRPDRIRPPRRRFIRDLAFGSALLAKSMIKKRNSIALLT
jgi:hypothetical protein